jgi:hypothetical protein
MVTHNHKYLSPHRTQYGLYQEAVHLCNSLDEENWKKATFWVFDSPNIGKTFEERIEHLKNLKLSSFVKIVDTIKCKGISDSWEILIFRT